MPMVKTAAVALLLSAGPALADAQYVIQCTASCQAWDGTTQPAGTYLNRIIARPDYQPGPNMTIVPDTGQSLYVQQQPVSIEISSLGFIQRFTVAEQQTLQTANPLWGLQIAAAGTINVTSPILIAQLQQAVTAGALTQARMSQVLNLSVPSP